MEIKILAFGKIADMAKKSSWIIEHVDTAFQLKSILEKELPGLKAMTYKISVNKKIEIEGYGPWTAKQNQFAVQPPIGVLENIFTIRIHLDDTDKNNGALKVIPNSHLKHIYRPENIDWKKESEDICELKKGGIMIMKPLLLHSSNRTTNNNKRRVIHIEFSNIELPTEIKWSERN